MYRPGTPEYKTVCGSGAPGTMVDPITGAQFEIDECTMMSGVCGSQGTCVNTIGSFKCDCRQGTLVVLDHSQNYSITNHNHIFKAMRIVFYQSTCRAHFVFDFLFSWVGQVTLSTSLPTSASTSMNVCHLHSFHLDQLAASEATFPRPCWAGWITNAFANFCTTKKFSLEMATGKLTAFLAAGSFFDVFRNQCFVKLAKH